MALQTKINGRQVNGIVGEFSDASPKTARAYIVYGKDDNSKPTFGKFFSFVEKALSTGSSDKTTCAKQGTNKNTAHSMGILVNPKEHYTNGFVTTLQMDAGASGTVATRGHIWVMASTNTQAGAAVFVDANGNLGMNTLTSGTQVIGAKWLKTATIASGKTEVLSEVAIDSPYLSGETTVGSL